jgi:hypothetical protein
MLGEREPMGLGVGKKSTHKTHRQTYKKVRMETERWRDVEQK